MAEGFVSLAAELRAAWRALETPAPPPSTHERQPLEARDREAGACERAVEELALLRLAALEAFERARCRLLEALARDVLARELMLAPADLDALAARALRAFAESEPVALVVAPVDAARVSSPLPVRVDDALCAGDLLIAVRDGEIDARFALRLAEALRSAGVDA